MARLGGADAHRWCSAAGRAVRGACGRVRENAWLVLQGTAAATLAWLIAKHLVHHHQPFFSPIAAVIGLNAARGGRGLNSVRLLVGVVVGIAVAELALYVGTGYRALAIAVFGSMTIAVMINAQRIVIGQAAAGAILTIALGYPEAGGQRLVDAFIGAGVALTFSQLLFPSEPIGLLRRAEAAALAGMADGLEQTAEALEHEDVEPVCRAIARLRDASDRLTDLGDARQRSRYIRHTLLWWRRAEVIARESAEAERLDLLGSSCFALGRTALAARADERAELAPLVRELAEAVRVLARAPGDHDVRRRAARGAMHILHRLSELSETYSLLTTGRTLVRMAATDVLLFAGVDRETAIGRKETDMENLDVRIPPATLWAALGSHRRFLPWRGRPRH
ncbi:Uncharacterized membrane protein YgaE, UPF0421/DUF939 family [Thermomonospora echinospora]|uniref:Uncharacterized membrane protein YgaE, UPF0421/DUF939 family n=1 Tax=Thermomonospora echinospora TaxID=1992 RepID=A0A1H5ZGA6_9ACTN|nr:Uncharacterized membrane protein YgaE, UPF0421/DUF939 family [Thermomonospora echinospora]